MGKHFFTKLVNADDAAFILDRAELLILENLRWGTTDKGATGYLESIPATLAVFSTLPSGTNICIGARGEKSGRYLVWFNWNSNGDHRIFLYDKNGNAAYTVIKDSDITGGLGFDKNRLIHSSCIIDGKLYWTDGNKEPRKINLGACIKGNNGGNSPISSNWQFNFPVAAHEIALIRKPPNYPPDIQKKKDAAFPANLVGKDSFQFAFRYIYFDGEKSVFSMWSEPSFMNMADEDYNYIQATMDIAEKIPQSVRLVQLVAIQASTLKCFVVRNWDRMDEPGLFDLQNGGTSLSFDFYNNSTEELIDKATSLKPYDSVPLTCEAMELDKNRLFLANFKEGYNTPGSTSLQLGVINYGSATSSVVPLYDAHVVAGEAPGSNTVVWNYTEKYVYLPDVSPAGYYRIINPDTRVIVTGGGVATPYSGPIGPLNFATDLEFVAATKAGIAQALVPSYYYLINYYLYNTDDITVTVNGLPAQASRRIFKGDSLLQAGVVFFDQSLRKCFVVSDPSNRFKVDPRNYDATGMLNQVSWSLKNDNPLIEIPDWAYYYAIVMTKSLTARFWVQSLTTICWYMKEIDGIKQYGDTAFSQYATAVAIDSTAMLQAGLGYTYTEGDICVIYTNTGQKYSLPVLGVDGKYILVATENLGNLGAVQFLFEIYTPYKGSEQEPFYELGQIYPIDNPGTPSRAYSQLSGIIAGDAFLVSRTYNGITYKAEAMSPNDKFWTRWYTNSGRPNVISRQGQAVLKTGIRFSAVYTPGTENNGLSTFEALDSEILAIEAGPIRKLIRTIKTQADGSVLLAIGEAETLSVYIGEAELSDRSGTTFLVKSEGVIGQVNSMRGSMGTVHPESVIEQDGRVLWLDALKGVMASYSTNGLFPVSNYKFRRITRQLCDALLSTPAATIEGFGSRPFVPGGIDPYHGEYLISVPKTADAAPKGDLPGYDSGTRKYPYDIWDAQSKTWVYKIDGDRSGGSRSYESEYFVTLGESLYGFKNGVLYQFNAGAGYDNVFGVDVKPRIGFVENGEPDSSIKIFNAMALECNRAPLFTHILTENPNLQSSDITKWKLREGVFEANILRDRTSVGVDGDFDKKLLFGQRMRGQWANILMEWESSNTILQFRMVSVSYSSADGHKTI